jgi:ComF family protein
MPGERLTDEHWRDLCAGCHTDLPFNLSACRRCALPLNRPVDSAADANTDLICGQCQQKPPLFEQTIAPFLYRSPLDYLIKALKFNQQLAIAPVLADLLGDAVEHDSDALPQCIIPLPLHPRRLRQRGFNQALELAIPLAGRFRLPLSTDVLRRSRHTPPQAELSLAARATNLRDAFTPAKTVPFRHIAIVDDVITSGSTVNEAARVLRRAGVEQIQIWACARTPAD